MKKVAAILLVFLPFFTHAQLEGLAFIDSIKTSLPAAKQDTNKVNSLYDLSYAYCAIDPDSAQRYGAMGLKLAQQLGWQPGIGQGYYIAGIINQVKAQYHESLGNFFNALKILEGQGGKEKKLLGRAYEGVGSVYMQTNYLDKALEYQLLALKIREELRDTISIAGNLSNIGNVYYMLQDYGQALQYHFKAQKLFNKLNQKDGIANCLVNIGCVYQAQGNLNKAIENYFNALKVYEGLNNNTGIAATLGNIGETYLALATDTTHSDSRSMLVNNKSAYLAKAVLYLNKAIATSKDNNQLDNISEFSKFLSSAYELSSNYKGALDNYKLYATSRDSVFSNSSKIKIANLETEFNLETQRHQIERNQLELTQKQTEQKLYITGITFLMVVIAYVGRKFIKQIRSNQILSKEKKKAMDRIEAQSNVLTNISHTQAHDVRGPITTILGLVSVFNHDDPADPMNKELLDDITEVTLRLDKTVQDIIRQENKLSHEDGA